MPKVLDELTAKRSKPSTKDYAEQLINERAHGEIAEVRRRFPKLWKNLKAAPRPWVEDL